jgi:uncharacterized membrane protein (UPF0127 family)
MKFYNEEKQTVTSGVKIYETNCGGYKTGEIKIDSKILSVDIADDKCKQDLGLSGRMLIKDDEGMIFIFEKLGNYGFWMKNMNFSLDIIWIDDNFKIVGIEKNLSTSTYPKSFGSKYLAKYVLEVSAGYSIKNNVKVGDRIIFSKK